MTSLDPKASRAMRASIRGAYTKAENKLRAKYLASDMGIQSFDAQLAALHNQRDDALALQALSHRLAVERAIAQAPRTNEQMMANREAYLRERGLWIE